MSSDPFEKSVLIVCHEDFDPSDLPLDHPLYLEYAFIEVCAADGFAAWKVESSAATTRVEVSSACQQYGGGFSQQALNRFFAETLVVHRVSAVVIVGLTGCTVDLPRVAALMGIPSVVFLDEPVEPPDSLDQATARWIRDSLSKSQLIIPMSPEVPGQWPSEWIEAVNLGNKDQLSDALASDSTQSRSLSVRLLHL